MVLQRKQPNKEILAFTYPCYICGNILHSAKQTINHVQAVHGYKLPVRAVGHRRPPDLQYEYQNNPRSTDDYDVSHYACPSCWFHCPEAGLKELSDHINQVHHPENVDPSKNNGGQIKGGEATNSDLRADLTGGGGLTPETEDEKYQEALESDQSESNQDEDMIETDTQPKESSKSKPDMHDVLQKLNELTDVFQKLFLKGKKDAK
ncbi:hypothetical protein [Parasitella parasitica]|uniref:C2H2-type domain-containing protein n=1 Tax=Parasitella parasitica TaxID=35722 RepID=A0A0B7MTM7_9FUNG|nr:hypothetical protein [Parasitella parasitica]